MKKLVYFLCLIILGTISCVAQNNYTVTGQISGLKEGSVVQLFEKSHSDSKPFNSAEGKGGKFVFKGSQKDPRGVLLIVKDSYGAYPFILNNSKILLTGNAVVTNVEGKDSYSFKITAKGSPLTELYQKKVSVRGELNNMYEQKDKKYSAVWNRYYAARNKKDTVLMKQIEQSAEYKAANEAEAVFF